VICLGDSHAQVLRQVSIPRAWFRVKAIVGVTASGLPNPKSKTRGSELFARRLDRARRWHQVLILLGEVDCGFVIWDRARRHGVSIDEQITTTLDAYQDFIAAVLGRGFPRVIILSVPLPTISDDRGEWGRVANQRGTVTASWAERTELTLRFNAELRSRCEALGAVFVDATTDTLDEQTGLIQARFVRDSQDHHLADEPYASLLMSKLGRLW
jgi:hypothetical protein